MANFFAVYFSTALLLAHGNVSDFSLIWPITPSTLLNSLISSSSFFCNFKRIFYLQDDVFFFFLIVCLLLPFPAFSPCLGPPVQGCTQATSVDIAACSWPGRQHSGCHCRFCGDTLLKLSKCPSIPSLLRVLSKMVLNFVKCFFLFCIYWIDHDFYPLFS